jgi:hypothetical protein
MNETHNDASAQPFVLRAIRFVVVGVMTVLLLYARVLAAVLSLGLEAIRKIPTGGPKQQN